MYPLTVLQVTVGVKTGKGGELDTPRATDVRGYVFFCRTSVITCVYIIGESPKVLVSRWIFSTPRIKGVPGVNKYLSFKTPSIGIPVA